VTWSPGKAADSTGGEAVGTVESRALAVVFVFGTLLWLAGAFALSSHGPLLSLGELLCGALGAVAAAYLFLTTRPSGRRDHGAAEATTFCLSSGTGLAAIGFALSPLTPRPYPALFIALCGIGLIAWSPRALRCGRTSA
jgi:hypothetical protein